MTLDSGIYQRLRVISIENHTKTTTIKNNKGQLFAITSYEREKEEDLSVVRKNNIQVRDQLKAEAEALEKAAHYNIVEQFGIDEDTHQLIHLRVEFPLKGTLKTFLDSCDYTIPAIGVPGSKQHSP